MIQLLLFHHKAKKWHRFHRIKTPYKKGGIIEVYPGSSGIDIVNKKSHLRVVRVENVDYDVQYRRRRLILRKLPRKDKKVLRRTGRVDINKEAFLHALKGVK